MIKIKIFALLVLCGVVGQIFAFSLKSANAAEGVHKVTFVDSMWNGNLIPKDQQCRSRGDGVNPHSPKLKITNLPAGTKYLHMIVTDADNGSPGDHGIFRLDVPSGTTEVIFTRIYETKKELPVGVKIVEGNVWGAGKWGHYMPPCSGGRGNMYYCEIAVFGDDDKDLGTSLIKWGEY